MTKQDHEEGMYHDECLSCNFVQEEEQVKAKEKSKAIDLELSKYSKLSDQDLESKWQSSANMIGMYAMASWKKDISDEESKRLHDLAEKSQEEQGIIQAEITRRSH